MERDYGIFILSNGRAGNVSTIKMLKKGGVIGKRHVHILIDDEDSQGQEYYKLYGDMVVQFYKKDYDNRVDTMDNNGNRKCVVYARNAVFDIAKEMGYKHFIVLDDDYKEVEIRYKQGKKLKCYAVKDLEHLNQIMFDFLDCANILTVCLGQGGDFIGGANGGNANKVLSRKAMNYWYCRTDRPFEFMGRMNEDATANVVYGIRGGLMFTAMQTCLIPGTTQKIPGGLTDIYLEKGTYSKSLYTVMAEPSCTKISVMQTKHKRVHHFIEWRYCCPKIINEKWKKR